MVVLSREFFTGAGHTVHTVAVIVDGRPVCVSPVMAGRGDGAAMRTARSCFDVMGIEWPADAVTMVETTTVCRRKDLHRSGRLKVPTNYGGGW
jgi:hypothetical protein